MKIREIVMRRFITKRIVSIVLAASMMLGMAGCGDKAGEAVTEDTETASDVASETDGETEGDSEGYDIPDELSVYGQADPDSEEALAEQKKFEEYLDESFKESVVSDTLTLHYTLADPESYGVEAPEATFGDTGVSEEDIASDKKETQDELDELQGFNYELLTSEQKFTYDVLENQLECNLESYDYVDLYEPFAYTSGLHSNLPVTMSEYTFYNTGDVEDYLSLLNQTGDLFQTYLDFEAEKAKKGYFMNNNNANEVIRQCNEFIANPEENLLIETFNDRIGDVPGITGDEITEYTQENYDAVMNVVIPAYENIINTFGDLKGTCKNEYGLSYYDNGKEYYEYLIRSKVGSDKTPDEIIELLESEISSAMTELYTLAYTDYEAYQAYYEDSDSMYEDADLKETIEYFEDCFADRFPEIPDIDFNISPVHESLQDIVSPAFFMTPPIDDYTTNTIHTNLSDDTGNDLWSTLAHEGVPGHMYQFVYFLSHDPEPIRALLDFNGYQEGWATYVELMSYDYYEDYAYDTYADFEKVNSELSLLISARVEIGVNYEGWTLDDTADYLNNNGFNGDAASDLYDYVIAEPANYQMYILGWLEFKGLREEAEEALGDSFDEKEFHEVLLDAGPCQFFLLEKLVDDYILNAKH
jgi:uncharacterized protein (DUF885 family)